METTANNNTTSHKVQDKLTKLFLAMLIVQFALNFAGSPILKYSYLLSVFSMLALVLFCSPEVSLPYFFPFFMIEGQGRILWNYNPIFRVLFDALLLLCAFKAFYSKKRVIDIRAIPTYIYILIFFHFLWFSVQLFNPNGVGFLGVVAAAKIYIIPFIIFLSFLANDGLQKLEVLKKIEALCLFTLFIHGLLVIFQYSQGESFITSITPYYEQVIGERFSGALFRPFGTTHLPGGYSIYIVLLLPFIFLTKAKNYKVVIYKLATVGISFYCLFLSQVRSGMIKAFFITFTITSLLYIRGQKRFKKIIVSFLAIFIFGYVITNVGVLDDRDIEKIAPALNRFMSIFDKRTINSSRETPTVILSYILERLDETPLGLGPGRTGAASNMNKLKIAADPIFGLKESWAYDNLFLSLAVELGIGAIFYLLIILLLPLKMINHSIRSFLRNDKIFPIVIISAIVPVVILIGNWGAIGLPYNPESFCFWFLLALGLKNIESREVTSS